MSHVNSSTSSFVNLANDYLSIKTEPVASQDERVSSDRDLLLCPSIGGVRGQDPHPKAIVQYFIPLGDNPGMHMKLSKMGAGPLGPKIMAGDRVYDTPGTAAPWQYEQLFGHPGKGGNILAGDGSVAWLTIDKFPVWPWFSGEGSTFPVNDYYVYYNFTGTSYRWFQPNATYMTSAQPPDLFF